MPRLGVEPATFRAAQVTTQYSTLQSGRHVRNYKHALPSSALQRVTETQCLDLSFKDYSNIPAEYCSSHVRQTGRGKYAFALTRDVALMLIRAHGEI